MTLANDHRYDLRIEGADKNTLYQFAAAFENTRLIDYMGQDPTDPSLFSTEVVYGSGGLHEEAVENELHALAMQFPNLNLSFRAEDQDDRGHGYELKFHGDLYQRADILSSLSAFCPPTPFTNRKEALLAEMEREGKVQEQLEKICKGTDFDLLFAQKEAIVNHLETGDPIPKQALQGLIPLLNCLGDLGEALGRFRYDGIDPLYPMQPDYIKTKHTFEPEQEKVHIFCEEHEGDDGIRSFTVLGVCRDKNALKTLLQAKVEKDEYGLIESNGIDDDFETLFSSQFKDGFVSYYILEEDIQTRDQTLAKLNTKEYNTAYEYPNALGKVLTPILKDILEQGVYSDYDLQKAAEQIKGEKGFQTIFKTAWWGTQEYFDIENKAVRSTVDYTLRSYLHGLLEQDKDYFVKIGAATPFKYPKNTKDFLINAIYDISKDYHLPVQDADKEAELIMQDQTFRNCFRNYGPEFLEFGSSNYENALWTCQEFVRSRLIPNPEPNPTVSTLQERMTDAFQRQEEQFQHHEPKGKENTR